MYDTQSCTDLLVDGRPLLAKHQVAGKTTRKQRVVLPLLAAILLLDKHQEFVQANVKTQVGRMSLGRPEYMTTARLPAVADGHQQRLRRLRGVRTLPVQRARP